MRALGYAVEEAWVSLRRSGRSALMSLATIAIAFTTLGAFLLAAANLEATASRWAEAAEMSVYLADGLDEAARQALVVELQSHPAVSAVEFISKDAALERFRSDFSDLADVAASVDNPFPASLEVRVRPHPEAGDAAGALAASLAARDGIADVRYDRQWLERLFGAIATVRIGGLVIAGVLMLGAAFTVAAVVRLSLEARLAEVDIMQLVGAPSSFVRGPFVVEGLLLGGVGALVALVILWAGFVALRGRVEQVAAAVLPAGQVTFLGPGDILLVALAGLIVGAASGAFASRAAR
jgi:cell division transport system permease protein